ncbi:MAG: GNAT family N-acetyltransferase [Candidatus Kariarchaeaceae archaeon]|jgi:RimJ/RimL family protein N-acetyltransferase
MSEDNPIGIQLRNLEACFNGYQVRHIRMKDLPELAAWPKFKQSNWVWANFSASTPSLQSRWYQNSVKPTVGWLIVRLLENNELISRCSVTQPKNSNDLVFGVVIRPDLVGKGLGTDITRGVMRFVMEISGSNGIWLESHHENSRARRVWEKIGYQFQSYHYRRTSEGEMDKFASYYFPSSKINELPEVKINKL